MPLFPCVLFLSLVFAAVRFFFLSVPRIRVSWRQGGWPSRRERSSSATLRYRDRSPNRPPVLFRAPLFGCPCSSRHHLLSPCTQQLRLNRTKYHAFDGDAHSPLPVRGGGSFAEEAIVGAVCSVRVKSSHSPSPITAIVVGNSCVVYTHGGHLLCAVIISPAPLAHTPPSAGRRRGCSWIIGRLAGVHLEGLHPLHGACFRQRHLQEDGERSLLAVSVRSLFPSALKPVWSHRVRSRVLAVESRWRS